MGHSLPTVKVKRAVLPRPAPSSHCAHTLYCPIVSLRTRFNRATVAFYGAVLLWVGVWDLITESRNRPKLPNYHRVRCRNFRARARVLAPSLSHPIHFTRHALKCAALCVPMHLALPCTDPAILARLPFPLLPANRSSQNSRNHARANTLTRTRTCTRTRTGANLTPFAAPHGQCFG